MRDKTYSSLIQLKVLVALPVLELSWWRYHHHPRINSTLCFLAASTSKAPKYIYQSCLLVLLLHPQTTIFDDESKKIQGGTSSFVLLALRPSDTVTGKKHLTDQGADEQGDSRSRI